MPQAKAKSSAGLSIELEQELPYFKPGDDVSGNVTLNTTEDFAIGSAVVNLYGRVKVHYIQSNGQSESHWRGRAPLFETSSLLYSGHHTHKPGTFSWPFHLSIPTHPDQTLLTQNKDQWQPRDLFLGSLQSLPDSPMPPTFTFRKRGFGYRWRAFVEYVLEVNVREAEGTHRVMRPTTRRVVMPLRVINPSDLEQEQLSLPIGINFTVPANPLSEKTSLGTSLSGSKRAMSTQISMHTIRSSKLELSARDQGTVPERSSMIGTLREKRNLLFSPNTVPAFTFEVQISVPETIQVLDDKRGIPVLLNIKPTTMEGKTTIPHELYPVVRLENITLHLRSVTNIRFKGAFRERTSNAEYDITLLDKANINHSISMFDSNGFSTRVGTSHPNELTATNNHETAAEIASTSAGSTIDLSTFPGLKISLGAAKQGSQTESPLAPTFRSYIITRRYELRWTLIIDVLGERVKVESQHGSPVTVINPTPEMVATYLGQTSQGLALSTVETTGSQRSEDADIDADDTAQNKGDAVKGLSRRFTQLLSGRGTKASEAAAERARSENGAGVAGEELPRYEQTRTGNDQNDGLRFRNQITEAPPDYENTI